MINSFPFSFFELSTYIFVLLTIWIVYVRYKEGYYTKVNDEEAVDSGKKLSKFKRWWRQSFIREIYVIRAGQRPFLCILPWLGVLSSLVLIMYFAIGIYLYKTNPFLPFDELKKYEGQVLDYKYHKKVKDELIVKLHNGEIKHFRTRMPIKEDADKWLNQKIIIWTQPDWYFGLNEIVAWEYVYGVENYHYSNFGNPKHEKQFYTFDNVKEHYEIHYSGFREFNKGDQDRIYGAIKVLVFFLVVLLFINRNPVKRKG